MAGSMSAIVDQWEVMYERFYFIPPVPALVPYPLLVPQGTKGGGVWSSMTKASLKLIAGGSSDYILNLSVPSEVLEEHRVSQLNFTWSQVSSASGFPATGTTAVARFKDAIEQCPKFRLNFFTTDEAERFRLLKKIRGARGDRGATSYSEMPSVQVEPLYRSEESLRNNMSSEGMLEYCLRTEEEFRRSKEDRQKKTYHGYSVSSGIWHVLPYN